MEDVIDQRIKINSPKTCFHNQLGYGKKLDNGMWTVGLDGDLTLTGWFDHEIVIIEDCPSLGTHVFD